MLKVFVQDIMSENIVKISETATVMEAAHILLRFQINGLLITKKNSTVPLGIFTTTDLLGLLDGALSRPLHRKQELERIGRLSVGSVASRRIVKVQKNTRLERVIALMHKKRVHTIPVYDGDTLVGIIGRHDILNAAFYTEKK